MYSHILSSELNVFNCVQELCTFGLYMCGYQMKTIQKVYNGVQHILCCVFAMIFFVLCTLCCQFLWIVHFWLPFWHSLLFSEIYLSTLPLLSSSSGSPISLWVSISTIFKTRNRSFRLIIPRWIWLLQESNGALWVVWERPFLNKR